MKTIAIRVGPLADGAPAIEFVLDDGTHLCADLTVQHASQVAERLLECIDGRVHSKPPSRRVLQIPLHAIEAAPSSGVSAVAVVPSLEMARRTQGAFP